MSPVVAAVAILAVVAIAVFAWVKFGSGGGARAGDGTNGATPPGANEKMQQLMKNNSGRSAPPNIGGSQGSQRP